MGKLVKRARKKLGWGAHFLSGGLLPPVKEINKAMGDKTFNQLHPGGAMLEQQYDATVAAQKAADEAKNAPAIPLADEEELARARRRRARRGSRSATVLSNQEQFGAG